MKYGASSGILHQEQEWNGKIVLRPIVYGSEVLSFTEMKYGAPKAEMFAVVTLVENYRALTRVTKKYGNLVMCYVDDVVNATPTLENHIERLESSGVHEESETEM